MSASIEVRIREALGREVAALGVEPAVPVVLEVPPRPEFGDLACPIAFELARALKRSPRDIAATLKKSLETTEGVERAEVAGGGYLNIFFDREVFLRALVVSLGSPPPHTGAGKRIVEHTNINPNKAAHIGHLRNAVLGDTLVRSLRFLGETVEVQNYIDDTGVQVADLAVGFVEIRKLTLEEIRQIAASCAAQKDWQATTRHFVPDTRGGGDFHVIESQPFAGGCAFDQYCWDLYSEVAPFYAASKDNASKRDAALRQMEEGHGIYAEIAAFVSGAMVLHHLRTMRMIGVHYDLLPHESDILELGFWTRAFELLKQANAIRFVDEGKARGCWVMDLPEAADAQDDGAKIIVRSNGTVTYVGKDIAYQLWKFGLLGRDFRYDRMDLDGLPADRLELQLETSFSEIPAKAGAPRPLDPTRIWWGRKPVWRTCSSTGAPDHPAFGGGARVYNVIDVRQAYLQKVVTLGLHSLGHSREALESIHFSYEMVALTPRSMKFLGDFLGHEISLSEEDMKRPYIEMSGRRGVGIQAADLMKALVNQAAAKLDSERGQEIPDAAERVFIAYQIAVGALRYYMLRFTKNRVIAFDFEDSLAFEGETGPYLQYAAVRSANIFHKLSEREGFTRAGSGAYFERARFGSLEPEDAIEHWQIVREMARLPEIVDQAVASLELSLLARYVFGIAQRFSSFYHRYPILQETDPARRDLRIAINELYLRFMETSLGLMGVPIPDRM